MTVIAVPEGLTASQHQHGGPAGRAWLAVLPEQAADVLARWRLQRDGPSRHGWCALVLPVRRLDGTAAVLKLQPLDEETAGEPIALRRWNGDGAVTLLDHDPTTGALLLERLDATRPLSALADDDSAVHVLAELLARLVALPAPSGLRSLRDIAGAMLDHLPRAAPALHDPRQRRLLHTCAAAVAELIDQPGDRLLHWDLHYDNVLAAAREPWLAIDPKPLAGDPGFDLLPALDNRWPQIVATGDVPRAVLRRFDHLTEALGLDRPRATGWTLARVLQNALWDIDDGETALPADQIAIATTLLTHRT